MDCFELNNEIREFCRKLINDGYTKSQICGLLLGSQKLPMFSQFLDNDNRNFGLSVLSGMLDAFGYKLELVPVLKESSNQEPKLNELNAKFLENYKFILMENLNNNTVRKDNEKKTLFQKAVGDLVSDIIANIITDDKTT